VSTQPPSHIKPPPAGAPFDAAASAYDDAFTHARMARELRGRVWARLDAVFAPGRPVLELGCGTGEDARHLAARGVPVVATDQSAAMLRLAAAKAAGLPVITAPLDLRALAPEPTVLSHAPYAGVFSNFGAVNALASFAPLAAWLAPLVMPGARVVVVVMGRWCAWEIGWHLLRCQPRTAFRRVQRGGAVAHVGGVPMTVHYPSTGALRRAFAPHFRLERVWPLGLLLPPSYLEPLTRRAWFPWRLLAALDRRLPWPLWADHTVYEWVRPGA
jgi:SAM-dependent methyltransferase